MLIDRNWITNRIRVDHPPLIGWFLMMMMIRQIFELKLVERGSADDLFRKSEIAKVVILHSIELAVIYFSNEQQWKREFASIVHLSKDSMFSQWNEWIIELKDMIMNSGVVSITPALMSAATTNNFGWALTLATTINDLIELDGWMATKWVEPNELTDCASADYLDDSIDQEWMHEFAASMTRLTTLDNEYTSSLLR